MSGREHSARRSPSQSHAPDTSREQAVPDARNVHRWQRIVRRIREGDEQGAEELYKVFSGGIRFHLCRLVGSEDLDDRLHDVFVLVLQAIRRGDLREPARLMGFVRTIVRRQVAAYICQAVEHRRGRADLAEGFVVADREPDPESKAIHRENADLMLDVLAGIGERDREILIRFYLLAQPPEQICRDLNLTETQFRLLKSRAKTRFGEIGRKRISRKPPASVSVRHVLSA